MTGLACRGILSRRDTIDWLLDSDPAIRSQTMRDLMDAAAATVAEAAHVPARARRFTTRRSRSHPPAEDARKDIKGLPIEPTQCLIALGRMDRRLAPEEPEQRIAVLGDFSESLPPAARVFTWNIAASSARRRLGLSGNSHLPIGHPPSESRFRITHGVRRETPGEGQSPGSAFHPPLRDTKDRRHLFRRQQVIG